MAPRTKSHCRGKRNNCLTIPGCMLTSGKGKRLSYCRKGKGKGKKMVKPGNAERATRNARLAMFASPKARKTRARKMSHSNLSHYK